MTQNNHLAMQTLNTTWMALESQRQDLITRISNNPAQAQYLCGYLECIKYTQQLISTQYDKQKAA